MLPHYTLRQCDIISRYQTLELRKMNQNLDLQFLELRKCGFGNDDFVKVSKNLDTDLKI